MNWRRGLLLAGINLAVAMPLVLWAESMDAAFMRDREHYAPKAAAVGSPTAESDEGSNAQTESVSFDPCHMIVELSTQERVLIGANKSSLPVSGFNYATSLDRATASRPTVTTQFRG